MPRIVAGIARGRSLAVPDAGTRPTSDRAREALFNSLGSLLDLVDARVLDLFAGSGAVGLEALSRGASTATFVESERAAAVVIAANIKTVALGGTLVRGSVEHYLDRAPSAPFDLVFADPPYATDDAAVHTLLTRLVAGDWLGEHAVVVVERSSRGPDLAWPDALAAIKHKRYGEGMLWYGRYSGKPASAHPGAGARVRDQLTE
jgi:16S rRNA (guanine966-N2)-methyltransferase